jgi:hypothetical protein
VHWDPNEPVEKWRQRYREQAEMLEIIRAQEIAAITEERGRLIIQSLVAVNPWRDRPEWSGLIEQQAIFRQKLFPSVFKGPSERTRLPKNGQLLPAIRPYRELNSFQGCPTVKKKRELFLGNREADRGSNVLPLMPHRGNGILTVFPFGTTGD